MLKLTKQRYCMMSVDDNVDDLKHYVSTTCILEPCPIFLQFDVREMKPYSSFKFDPKWLSNVDFWQFVVDN